MPTPTYHVGLLAKGRTAVFQFRRSVDFLSCEILRYLGERRTTKADAKRRLSVVKEEALAGLNKDFHGRNFNRIVID